MAWAALTADDVKTRLSGDELTLLQTKALSSGQADPLAAIIAAVTDFVRGYIAVKYQLGADGTLPRELKDAAIAIVRWRLIGRLAAGQQGAISGSEHREKEKTDAIALLQSLTKGEFAIEQPDPLSSEVIATTPGEYGSDDKLDFSTL